MSDERTSRDVRGNSARICRELGWYKDTVLESVLPPRRALRITAVGEELVLGRDVYEVDGQLAERDEQICVLTQREWRKAEIKAEG